MMCSRINGMFEMHHKTETDIKFLQIKLHFDFIALQK